MFLTDSGVDDLVQQGIKSGSIVGRKAWTAYLGLLIKYSIIFSILYFVEDYLRRENLESINPYLSYFKFAYILFFIFFIYYLAVIRSYRVFYNIEGIWITWGIFPWAKGADGIRWADADMAGYRPTFISWLCNSYSIFVKHKYTNNNDWMVSSIWRGRVVARSISNEQRKKLGIK